MTIKKTSAIKTKSDFIPPYCPNHKCTHHQIQSNDTKFYHRDGWHIPAGDQQRYQRFQCKACGKKFSYQTFQIDYRFKIDRKISASILYLAVQGLTNRSIARFHNISEATVRARIRYLSKQSILQMRSREQCLKINEPIVYDGFETFFYSQFDPCHVNNAIGKNSHFQYDINFSYLNRKGSMTETQKMKLDQLEKMHGRYPSSSVRMKTKSLVARIAQKVESKVEFHCDQHPCYIQASQLYQEKLTTITTNSNDRRDPSNRLFAVNHLHFLYRQHTAAHQRQTCAFQKNEAGLMERMIIFQSFKNYMSPVFIRKNTSDDYYNVNTPAMILSLTDRLLSFDEFYEVRLEKAHAKLNQDDENIYSRIWKHSRRKIKIYRN